MESIITGGPQITSSKISIHNSDSEAHQDIRNLIPTTETTLSNSTTKIPTSSAVWAALQSNSGSAATGQFETINFADIDSFIISDLGAKYALVSDKGYIVAVVKVEEDGETITGQFLFGPEGTLVRDYDSTNNTWSDWGNPSLITSDKFDSSTEDDEDYPSCKAVTDNFVAQSNKVTSVDSSSTDDQVPSALAVYNALKTTLTFNDTYAADCNSWLTNGYIKTKKDSTKNLPSTCTGKDQWGILFFIAENAANGTGTQMYFPIDGTNIGRIFTRSLVNASSKATGTKVTGEWKKLAFIDEVDASSLPTVTTEDNGKILMVVDGKWAAVSST